MKKFIALLLVFLLALPVIALAKTGTGLIFTATDNYQTSAPLSGFPVTFEASIKLDAGYAERGGVIIGSYSAAAVKCVNFEIHTNGAPRLYYIDNDGNTGDYKFTSVNVATGDWVHLAIAMDRAQQKGYCYVDGVLLQTLDLTVAYPESIDIKSKCGLGTDVRSGAGQYFKGSIRNVCLYSDLRSNVEIAEDAATATPATDGLMAAYTLSANEDGSYPEIIEDASGSGNNFNLQQTWISKEPALNPYAYSMAVVGDIQIVNRDYPAYVNGIYEWILDNIDEKNTKFIFSLGDITDDNTEREYVLAENVYRSMLGVVPLSFVRGNHDTAANYTKYFPYSRYGKYVNGSMDDNMLNTYVKFDVGNIKYLVLNIDMNRNDNIIAWANQICEENPDRNIIVTTHGYMNSSGNPLDGTSEWPSRYGTVSGQDLWDKVISQHSNIVMVLCGHIPSAKIVVSKNTGVNGNEVTQVLIDPQGVDDAIEGGVGLVAMLYFSEDGKQIQVRYYSTIKKAYYMSENQFTFNIETVGGEAAAESVIKDAQVDMTTSDEVKATVYLDEGRCTYTADAAAAIKDGTLNLSVVTTGNMTSGKVLAGCYDAAGRLLNIKTYDVSDVVQVTFDNFKPGMTVKVRWWRGDDTMMPIGHGFVKGA